MKFFSWISLLQKYLKLSLLLLLDAICPLTDLISLLVRLFYGTVSHLQGFAALITTTLFFSRVQSKTPSYIAKKVSTVLIHRCARNKISVIPSPDVKSHVDV